MLFGKDDKSVKKYKAKEVKTYASDEWMANSTKKYRTVFDKAELSYVRVEFSFYNKLFDEEDWSAVILLKCFEIQEGSERREICKLDTKRDIRMDENIVYVRDGWGNPTAGAYWKKGEYVWEAYVDDELAGSRSFYVNDIGAVQPGKNPYFEVEHLKLYPGDAEGWKNEERKYLRRINRAITQYLWLEFKLRNKSNLDWRYEIFFNFYDDALQPKGQVTREGKINDGKLDYRYTFDAGWGNEVAGSWKDDRYILEVVFMDTLVAAVQFEVSDAEEEGMPELVTSGEHLLRGGPEKDEMGAEPEKPKEKEPSLEELLAQLDKLIGLEEVKKNVRNHVNYLNFVKLRKEKGFEESEKLNLHAVFTGNPGTGKTTVVNMLGKIYKKMGLLSKGHVHEVDRAELVGEFIGQTAPKVKKAIDQARGGILFIDEAYALARAGEDSKDFGKEVIEIIIKEMSDGPGDIAIMAAGYPKEMNTFIESNPGLKSRFTHFFHFDDYLPDELMAIAMQASIKRGLRLTPDAADFLNEQLLEAFRTRDHTFGNARFANAVIDEAKMNMGLRLMASDDVTTMSNEALSTIEKLDLEKVFTGRGRRRPNLGINEKLLREALDELNGLTGMNNIKNEVNELVKLVRFYQEIGKDVLNKFSLHAVFTGNPGTGKTTLARIIAKIYKGLGLLEKGHIVEVDRQGLVAGYVGHTAIKTQEKIDEAIGGVLFIDEAYALGEGGGSQGDFGKEAVEVILKRMEDLRGQFAVIVAGYPENMHNFMNTNPGLKSRFDRTYVFEDYNADELYAIAMSLLRKEKITPTSEAHEHLKSYLKQIFDRRDKYFGNARTVRQVIAEAVKNQNLRLAGMPAAERTPDVLATLTLDDVKEFELKETGSRGSLGFRYGQGGQAAQ